MKVVIVEDEIHAQRRLERLLNQYFPEIEIVAMLADLASFETFLKKESVVDLFFLDIQLGDGVIFEALENHPLAKPIIFTTAFENYAIRAFKELTVDYLLKPIKVEELQVAIEKFRKVNWQREPETDYLFKVESSGIQKLIPISEVALFFIRNKVTYLMTFSGKQYAIYQSLEEIEESCDSQKYFRVNRQAIINRSTIQDAIRTTKSRLILNTTTEAPFKIITSTQRSQAFKHWYFGG